MHALELTDGAMKSDVRQHQPEGDTGTFDDLVPAIDAALAVGGIVVTQAHVDGGERRLIHPLDLAIDELEHRVGGMLKPVVVLNLALLETALEAGVERVRRIGGNLRAEEIQPQRAVKVELLMHGWQIDHAQRSNPFD